jgi:hypothetical protein
MKLLTATAVALRHAVRNPRLVLLLWGAHLAIAAVAFYPALRLLDRTLANAPAGDEFLRRFSLPLFGDVMRSGRAWFEGFGQLLTLVFVLTLLWNVLAAGGALESLLSGDPARMAHRFGRGAGRFFGRFLRMGLAAAPAALLVAGVLAGPIFAVRASLDDNAEGAQHWLGSLASWSRCLRSCWCSSPSTSPASAWRATTYARASASSAPRCAPCCGAPGRCWRSGCRWRQPSSPSRRFTLVSEVFFRPAADFSSSSSSPSNWS